MNLDRRSERQKQLNHAIGRQLRAEMQATALTDREWERRKERRSSSVGVTTEFLLDRMRRDPEVAEALGGVRWADRLLVGQHVIPAWFLGAAARAIEAPIGKLLYPPVLDEAQYAQQALYQQALDSLSSRSLPDIEAWERLLELEIEIGNHFRRLVRTDREAALKFASSIEAILRRGRLV